MSATLPSALAADLSPAARAALDSILAQSAARDDVIMKLVEALEVLNRLDDKRAAEIAELRQTLLLLCTERGLETVVEPLVERIRAYTPPPSVKVRDSALGSGYCTRCHEWIPSGDEAESEGNPYHRSCYQLELRELRDRRRDLDA